MVWDSQIGASAFPGLGFGVIIKSSELLVTAMVDARKPAPPQVLEVMTIIRLLAVLGLVGLPPSMPCWADVAKLDVSLTRGLHISRLSIYPLYSLTRGHVPPSKGTGRHLVLEDGSTIVRKLSKFET